MDRKERAREVVRRLEAEFPDWECSLHFEGPWQLLVATILSAQSTDANVNRITPALFRAFPTPQAMADADPHELERLVYSAGYYRQKARHIRGASRLIVADFGGEVPRTMEGLTRLQGVARKTANVVLHNAFHVAEGIAVDTHVQRVAHRLGLTRHRAPDRIEADLMRVLPRDHWHRVTHLLIEHGRKTCSARKPACSACTLRPLCPSAARFIRAQAARERAGRRPPARSSVPAGARGPSGSARPRAGRARRAAR